MQVCVFLNATQQVQSSCIQHTAEASHAVMVVWSSSCVPADRKNFMCDQSKVLYLSHAYREMLFCMHICLYLHAVDLSTHLLQLLEAVSGAAVIHVIKESMHDLL